MENEFVLKTVQEPDCGCCQGNEEEAVPGYGCHEKWAIFTPREQAVLEKIRKARERALSIKKEIERFCAEGRPELSEKAILELESLRVLRATLEQERLAAAEERMRLLGHA